MTVMINLPDETVSVSDIVLQRYDVNAPRYTSYPTSPHWDDAFDEADYRRVIEQSNPSGRPLSLYMHLPFCEQMCLFCGCNVIVRHNHEAAAADYLPPLKREIEVVTSMIDKSRQVVQFHWGGGTPTYFSPDQLTDLFTYTRDRVTFADDAEIGVELDPRVTTSEHLDALKALGFNRLSLGVQDFDPDVQRTINRVQPYEQVAALVQACRQRGFSSLNFDLIYGLPGQTPQTFGQTLAQVLTLRPERIALFSYGHVPWVKRQQQVLDGLIPLGADKFALFCLGLQTLTAAGYTYVGMDHFALPDDELCLAQRDGTLHRNFQGYTTKSGADLLAVGITGISELARAYVQNVRGLGDYRAAIGDGHLPVLRGVELSDEDVIRRDAISQLLCYGSINKAEFGSRWGIDFDEHFAHELPRLQPLRQDGLLDTRDDAVSATTMGRIFIRVIAAVFDQYLQQTEEGPKHSRTV
ncbi:MAG: oxygen-independent coproporphyrinogen III oxidase [Propionibacteriaceae bacterium]|nr:oxygen-independent coproporphyrinogen III oxidase [Propionibacteriaceae bacterium]